MNARTFTLAIGATFALATQAPTATPANEKQVAALAIMTLQRLGNTDWQLEIRNSTPRPVTITQITWTAPAGLNVERITNIRGGACKLSDGGLQCKTHLAAPSCRSCMGDSLSVRFIGTGPQREWADTGSGGYWVSNGFRSGRAVIVASPARAQTSARTARVRGARHGALAMNRSDEANARHWH